MTKTEQIINKADNSYHAIYRRFPIAFDHGDGVYLYDAEGKEYIDFGAGIAVMALGCNHKRYNDALKSQVDKLIHTSNLFYHEQGAEAGNKLRDASGLPHVFFTNSGTEAVEGALKLTKKFANLNCKEKYNIIAMNNRVPWSVNWSFKCNRQCTLSRSICASSSKCAVCGLQQS